MEVNNFNQIVNLLSFESEDDFYHLQILRRKKDLPEHERGRNNNARCIKTYYIKNKEYLLEKENEIKALCHMFTARAYINLNKKSFKKSAILTVAELTNRIIQNQEGFAYRTYESVVGGSKPNVGEKMWIVDIDTKNAQIINETVEEICKCQSSQDLDENGLYKNIYDFIPTVNGWHIITCPFNIKQLEPFMCKYPFDIQKNNPTLLYFKIPES